MGVAQKHWYRFKFLKSDKWMDFRLRALVFHGQACVVCKKEPPSLDIHHIWYPKRDMEVWDVRPLCRKCHDEAHESTNPKSYKEYELAVRSFSEFASSKTVPSPSSLKRYSQEVKIAREEQEKLIQDEAKDREKLKRQVLRQKETIVAFFSGRKIHSVKRFENVHRWIKENIEDPFFLKEVLLSTGLNISTLDIDACLVQVKGIQR